MLDPRDVVRAAIMVVVVAVAARSADARTWTDRAGRQLDAEFVGFADGKVEIRRTSDGKTFHVPLERFSDADQAFVKSATQPDPPKPIRNDDVPAGEAKVADQPPAKPTKDLKQAVLDDDLLQVKAHLYWKTDVNAGIDADRTPPLVWAAYFAHKEVAELLITRGANVNATDKHGRTPLHVVFIGIPRGGPIVENPEDRVAVLKLLLAKGADVNARDTYAPTPDQKGGNTPLHFAVLFGAKGLIDLLLEKGADVNLKNNNGETPLACATGAMATKLRSHGATEPDSVTPQTTFSIPRNRLGDQDQQYLDGASPPATGAGASRDSQPPPDGWPKCGEELAGPNEVRIKNPNSFEVRVGLRSSGNGRDFLVPANRAVSTSVPNGPYKIYFCYSTEPESIYQGDDFTLANNGVEIQIVKVVDGNYGIRKVK